MTNKAKLILALCIVGVAGACLIGLLTSRSSVRDYIAHHYAKAPAGAVAGGGARSHVYAAPSAPSATAARIASAWKPAQESDQANGTFLRYQSAIVGVVPDGKGGSLITVDEPRDGYVRWFPNLGGTWGTASGRGETFRGGGPGTGK